ncbi:hypothetical protein HK101_003191 [Irineochytrium annulatum]|nr:hypothetical protein HK101_003191 [Irineochytrium annulatum]
MDVECQTSGARPILAYFPDKPENIGEIPFRCFVRKDEKPEKKDGALPRVLVAGDNGPVEYVGDSADTNVASTYAVGIYNRKTNKLTLADAHVVRMSTVVKRLKTPKSRLIGQKSMESRNTLGQTFGTIKRKKAIKAMERNKLTATSVSMAEGMIKDSIDASAEVLPMEDVVMAEQNAKRPIPPFDINATSVRAVYKMSDIVTDEELNVIDVEHIKQHKFKEDLSADLTAARVPEWAQDRIHKCITENGGEKKLRQLIYLSYMTKMYESKPMELQKGYLFKGMHRVISDKLIARFTVPDPRNAKKCQAPESMKLKLLGYILCMCLILEDYSLPTKSIANSLKIPESKVILVMKELGCKVDKGGKARGNHWRGLTMADVDEADDVQMDDAEPVEEAHDDQEYGKSKKDMKNERKRKLAEQNEQLNESKAADSMKRYAYLLGQTDLFSHFINLGKLKGENRSAFTAAVDKEQTGKKAKDGSRRHRMTEKEEDEQMLRKEEEEEDVPAVFTESPAYVKGGVMRDYQLQGLNWLISLYCNGINGILADEMGLGKTLQSISFLGYLKHVRGIHGKHIIIVPKTTLGNWMSEIKRWVPDLNAFLFHGDKETRAHMVRDTLTPEDFDILVTSYEMCLLEKTALRKISWQYLIIDEAHRVKNENSSLSQIVREFNCRNRLLITGTPLQNNLHELWALLNFLLPDVFSSSDDFNAWFDSRGGDEDQVVQQLHKVLRPFLLRRIKMEVEKSLLPKKRTNLYVGMSAMQRKWYQKILEKDIDAVNGSLGGKKSGGKTRLLNIVMQLRKCCNHPYLFDGAEPGPPYTTDEHLVENAGKMVILDKLLAKMKENGSRVLLFSQMSRMLDILEDYCVFRGFDYCRIDGNTAHEDRVAGIDEFNREGSSKFIFLLTTRAGGLGINLATANIVIMYDNDWNPQVDLQAEDRAHRIGQTKQVIVFRFITENAIEEKVIDRATQKLRLDQLVIQQNAAAAKASAAASKDELLSMIQHGAQSIFSSAESTIANTDIEDVLKRGEEKSAELDKKYSNMGLDDVKNFISDGSAYQWEGADFRSQKKEGGHFNWIQPAKRSRTLKDGSYAIDDYYRSKLNVGGKATRGRKPMSSTAGNNDHQFLHPDLLELELKESYAKKKAEGVQAVKRQPANPEETDETLEKERLEEQAKIDTGFKSFDNWSKKDFQAFIKANEKYGRDNIIAIANEVDGKTPEEVKRYAAVFWERYKEMQDWEKQLAKIEQGEKQLQKHFECQETLRAKVASYRLPLQQLRFNYGQSRGKNYTEEEDRFMIVCLERFGYGTEDVYERIRAEIKQSCMFRFDWFIKSRTAAELSKRCQTLISILVKEEAEEREREDKKRFAAAAKAGQAKKGKK